MRPLPIPTAPDDVDGEPDGEAQLEAWALTSRLVDLTLDHHRDDRSGHEGPAYLCGHDACRTAADLHHGPPYATYQ